MIRAKFRCTSVTEHEGATKQYVFVAETQGEENKSWAKWTPSGKLEISITNPDAQKFEPGKRYYLDFAPAE